MAASFTTAEGLRYYVVDGRACWSPPPVEDDGLEDVTDVASSVATVPSRASAVARDALSMPTLVEMLHELHGLCHEQHFMEAPTDVASLASHLDALKADVVSAARHSHSLQLELQELERTIALHIHHRMEVEDRTRRNPPALSKDASSAAAALAAGGGSAAAAPRLSPTERQHYETLLYLLRVHPSWLAQMVLAAGGQ